MKSSLDGCHVKIKNRRPLFTSSKISGEKVDSQNELRDDLFVQPERKRSRIDEPVSSNVCEKNSSDVNQGKDLIAKSINQSGTVTDNKTQNVQRTACTETQCLRPDFQRKVVLNSEGSLNVRRKRSNKRNLTVTSDCDKASSDRKDILDDELLWLPTVSNNNDSCTSMRMDGNHVIDTCAGMFSQDSFTDLFASSTSTPLSTPQSNIQHSLRICSGNSFLEFLDDNDDLKLAELDVSGIISSYNSACNKLEKQTLQSDNNDLMKVEIKTTKSSTACKTFKLSHVENNPKKISRNINTNVCDEVHNSSLNKLLHESDQKIRKQMDTIVGINIQNELDSSSKTIGNTNDEVKNGCQTNDPKTCDEQFYGLSSRVENMIKKHKGIEKLYEWQNDCLNLPAVKKRQNLIYSLPTSGGKTLVAEILIMKELLCQEKDALLILPFVSIVQEKVRDMSLFAVDLEFLVEEYAASKGKFPPRKRRKKKSLYIATIEKANGLVNSLIEDNRISEIGLVVVDEIHMLGEGGHRGATLEMCLAKILFCSSSTQVIGMSATLNNIEDLQQFLNAEKYINEFRPVKLKEYIKVENEIFEVKNDKVGRNEEIPLKRSRKVKHESTDPTLAFNDPDHLSVLAQEVIPKYSCLVFCPTKLNCQNVAKLLAKSLSRDLKKLKVKEKHDLLRSLKTNADGICPVLRQVIPYGIAYHHGGLTMDERKLIEEAYSQGTLCLLTCTSTLAAGVNLPAKRVILRNPYVGKNVMTRSQYKQMIGRAGRAGIDTSGESIMIVDKRDKDKVLNMINAPLESCHSSLLHDSGQGLRSLVLSLIGLKVCNSLEDINLFTLKTLLAVQNCSQGNKTLLEKINENVDALVKLRLVTKLDSTVNDGTTVEATPLGRATFKGCVDVDRSPFIYDEVKRAQENLVLTNDLHLLYLVTSPDMIKDIKPNWMTYLTEVG